MSKLTRKAASVCISDWSVDRVADIFKKNGLEDSCIAVVYKRQINGDDLMHLTEGKLALWRKDLSRPLLKNLWQFVEKVQKTPEDYVIQNDDHNDSQDVISDSGSWGTDFEDDDDAAAAVAADNENVAQKMVVQKDIPIRSLDFSNNLEMFQNNQMIIKSLNLTESNSISNSKNIYSNCNSDNNENTYINLEEKTGFKSKNISQLHDKLEKKLTLGDQYKNIWNPEKKKLTENSEKLSEKSTMGIKQVQRSFLHTNLTSNELKQVKKNFPPLPPPERPDIFSKLSLTSENDNGEYESFDEEIIEENRRKMGSKQSLFQGSAESVYKPASVNSLEKESEYEIYEAITENPNDNEYYLQPISSSSTNSSTSLESRCTTSSISVSKIINNIEPTPEKKSYSASSTSLSAEMRASRPLPQPPMRQSYYEFRWFHKINREQASALIKERAYNSHHNGHFLVRPSTSDYNNPLVLVLWFKDRVYNVPIRKRSDTRFALGSPKLNEQTFTTVEDIIKFYTREALVLYSGGVQMGSTKLTDSPTK